MLAYPCGKFVGVTEVKFHFIKSNSYTEHVVHGAFGGIHPTGKSIFMAVYSERPPIPTLTTHSITEEGKLSEEIRDNREVRDGIIRMVQCGLHMNIEEAVALRDWLSARISELSEIKNEKSS